MNRYVIIGCAALFGGNLVGCKIMNENRYPEGEAESGIVLDGSNEEIINRIRLASLSEIDAWVRQNSGIQAPLLVTASSNSERADVIFEILRRGGNVNVADEKGVTALHWAANCNYQELVTILLKAGARVNARSMRGDTPLDHAAGGMIMMNLSPQSADLILKAGGVSGYGTERTESIRKWVDAEMQKIEKN